MHKVEVCGVVCDIYGRIGKGHHMKMTNISAIPPSLPVSLQSSLLVPCPPATTDLFFVITVWFSFSRA